MGIGAGIMVQGGLATDPILHFGGNGYIAETAIEHYFRDAWAIGVELGTEEELKNIVADRILGPDSVNDRIKAPKA